MMTPESLLRYLAFEIVEMEEEAGCVGASANHLLTLIKESIKAEGTAFAMSKAFASELDQATQEKEDEVTLNEAFHSIVEKEWTPDEEEAMYAGGEEE